MECFDPYGFDRDLDLVITILAGPTGGLSEVELARGLIGGGKKAFGVDKAFGQPHRMDVTALPVLGQSPGG